MKQTETAYIRENGITLRLELTAGLCTGLDFTDKVENQAQASPAMTKAIAQVKEYLAGRRTNFDLALNPAGTEFQKQVWNALLQIPYGETRSYKDIAAWIGRPKAVRAVGGAIGKNPIAIIIPCHRVIGADGTLTGFAGGLEIKARLLELESRERGRA